MLNAPGNNKVQNDLDFDPQTDSATQLITD